MESQLKSDRLYREACTILETLEQHGFEARFAGGCVRDRILGRIPKDYDLACTAKPDEVCTIFRQKNMKVVPTGIDHGTVTVVAKFGAYEVTTLRKDVSTDGRHAQVVFGNSFEEDALRRDFTMNAMFEDRHGQVFDYFQGQEHLSKKELHFVGDARQRIREDFLRILRLFRFWARYNCSPNKQTLQAVEELAAGLAQISQERITQELIGLLEAGDIEQPLSQLFSSQIMVMIMPDAQPLSREEIAASAKVKIEFRAVVRLSVLLRQVTDPRQLEALCHKLKLSRKQHRMLEACNIWGQAVAQVPATQANFMALADQCEDMVEDFFLDGLLPAWSCLYPEHRSIINKARITEETKRYLRKAPLPIDTKDIMVKFNIVPGPRLGAVKDRLIESFRNESWHTRDEGLAWLEEHIQDISE
ncbi:CCA tRNA nucleotidyltransferase [Pseudobacteriovorax antillogorgiicola]|uniref:tRNA nucleotidyltransferase (CCA-adding enzyme) n=1 Tax=Pseudobacteriovorax antillogorgiicola TaxID=1513793 RepID=A0A1Y6BLI8_9BACT|nr:CCA tRNA nucleotidyltransferase [Pseudobacteriovorax antillogorgiicola]TCS54677.1 tRNA nucleotidyltransferase (CCA-adding enzyme) [Pseudobacteriovorax antillogorgiicola]SMF16619.1 tRNA nucleotidyltransferase (CCA-adding enzyme) [Pseudobacteriovorax antillogorgiicola]